MALSFKFQLMPREEGFLICKNRHCLYGRTVLGERRHASVRNYRSVQCIEARIVGTAAEG
jgi:hypothetical protein